MSGTGPCPYPQLQRERGRTLAEISALRNKCAPKSPAARMTTSRTRPATGINRTRRICTVIHCGDARLLHYKDAHGRLQIRLGSDSASYMTTVCNVEKLEHRTTLNRRCLNLIRCMYLVALVPIPHAPLRVCPPLHHLGDASLVYKISGRRAHFAPEKEPVDCWLQCVSHTYRGQEGPSRTLSTNLIALGFPSMIVASILLASRY